MGEIEPNAILADGPEPFGGRHICAGPDTVEYRAAAIDGSHHVWQRSYRLERLKGRGWARVYAHVSDAEPAESSAAPDEGMAARPALTG